jgi:DNA-binding NtrC family response regulator
MKNRVLIVDDEKLVCWSLSEVLTGAGFAVETALSGAEAQAKFETFHPEMVLLDVRLPDVNGLTLLANFKALDEDVVVVMITAFADADSAVNALKAGADDYIGKPFDVDYIRHVVERLFEKKLLRHEVNSFKRELRKKYDYDNFVGNSPKAIEVFKLIRICAETDVKIVLVLGESGTGKQLVSRAIHYHSARADAPFIETNCAAIPEHLLENELFGHEKGAFTDASARHKGIFETANSGTVFLDEIGDMPLIMQAKILKVIDSNTFRRLGGADDLGTDVRIIAATNQNLQKLVADQQFRGDLFYRLNVMTIRIPPLRERREDIPALVNYFIERLNKEYGKSITGVSPETLECLSRFNWPGNVRELRNMVERAMMLEEGRVLTPRYFSQEIRECSEMKIAMAGQVDAHAAALFHGGRSIRLPVDGISLDELEKDLIGQALERFTGNQTLAAKCLRMSRDTLRYRMKKYNLEEQKRDVA